MLCKKRPSDRPDGVYRMLRKADRGFGAGLESVMTQVIIRRAAWDGELDATHSYTIVKSNG